MSKDKIQSLKIEQSKIWIKDYINKISKYNTELINKLEKLYISIDFIKSDKSLNLINHFYNLRNDIQENHIQLNNFNKVYKKLNEKLSYHIDKMIKQLYVIDIQGDDKTYRLHCFKTDISYIQNDINNQNI